MNSQETLTIFNIQKYSLHDGTGIRTVVFLKGCPLHCRWCCNPESQNPRPELMYREKKCIGCRACGRCVDVCPGGAIRKPHAEKPSLSDDKVSVDFARCSQCMKCVEECPSGALKTEGQTMTIGEILDEVEKDAAFYGPGNGGMTVSGGEPLFQAATVALLREAKERYLNTAIETCGFVPAERLLEAAGYLDQIFMDIKSVNDEKHESYTGRSGRKIRENLEALCKAFPDKPITVRTPVIPGFNDFDEELSAIEDFLRRFPGIRWQKLPYHTYGVGKYRMLGRKYEL